MIKPQQFRQEAERQRKIHDAIMKHAGIKEDQMAAKRMDSIELARIFEEAEPQRFSPQISGGCLLYTSDAADE